MLAALSTERTERDGNSAVPGGLPATVGHLASGSLYAMVTSLAFSGVHGHPGFYHFNTPDLAMSKVSS